MIHDFLSAKHCSDTFDLQVMHHLLCFQLRIAAVSVQRFCGDNCEKPLLSDDEGTMNPAKVRYGLHCT